MFILRFKFLLFANLTSRANIHLHLKIGSQTTGTSVGRELHIHSDEPVGTLSQSRG